MCSATINPVDVSNVKVEKPYSAHATMTSPGITSHLGPKRSNNPP